MLIIIYCTDFNFSVLSTTAMLCRPQPLVAHGISVFRLSHMNFDIIIFLVYSVTWSSYNSFISYCLKVFPPLRFHTQWLSLSFHLHREHTVLSFPVPSLTPSVYKLMVSTTLSLFSIQQCLYFSFPNSILISQYGPKNLFSLILSLCVFINHCT
jgi:hypothetical protein